VIDVVSVVNVSLHQCVTELLCHCIYCGRYQIVAGVIEQRILEPWLHDTRGALSLLSFVVRPGNTFLGSLL